MASLSAAARAARPEALQSLQGECGVQLTKGAFAAAAGSRSLPTVQWLLQAGCPMSESAYSTAAAADDAGMVLWLQLAQEVGCRWDRTTRSSVIHNNWTQGPGRMGEVVPRKTGMLINDEVLVGWCGGRDVWWHVR